MIHDCLTTVGLFSLTGLQFDLTTVAAILTIAGFSINDTVVIYDRMRENLRKYKSMDFRDLINRRINETLSRTIMTNGLVVPGRARAGAVRRPGARRLQHRHAVGHGRRHLFDDLRRRAADGTCRATSMPATRRMRRISRRRDGREGRALSGRAPACLPTPPTIPAGAPSSSKPTATAASRVRRAPRRARSWCCATRTSPGRRPPISPT